MDGPLEILTEFLLIRLYIHFLFLEVSWSYVVLPSPHSSVSLIWAPPPLHYLQLRSPISHDITPNSLNSPVIYLLAIYTDNLTPKLRLFCDFMNKSLKKTDSLPPNNRRWTAWSQLLEEGRIIKRKQNLWEVPVSSDFSEIRFSANGNISSLYLQHNHSAGTITHAE